MIKHFRRSIINTYQKAEAALLQISVNAVVCYQLTDPLYKIKASQGIPLYSHCSPHAATLMLVNKGLIFSNRAPSSLNGLLSQWGEKCYTNVTIMFICVVFLFVWMCAFNHFKRYSCYLYDNYREMNDARWGANCAAFFVESVAMTALYLTLFIHLCVVCFGDFFFLQLEFIHSPVIYFPAVL